LLLSLGGMGSGALRERLASPEHGAVLDESIGHFAASIRHRPMSAVQMARVLADYFDVPVRAEQFVGSWYAVPQEQQTLIGKTNSVLGGGALAGARVWQRDLRMRIVTGPLTRSQFNAHLPGGLAARALTSMLTMFTGVSLEYEVQLVLRAQDVGGVTLCREESGLRLGWDTFLGGGNASEDRGDVCYQIHAV
jgi:type VI secretion system protein ImpH